MKNILMALLLIPALGSAVAVNSANGFQFGPRYSYRMMGFDQKADVLLPKKFHQAGLFAYYGFMDNFGAELELFTTFTKEQKKNIDKASVFGIDAYTTNDDNSFKTNTGIKGMGLNLYAHYPVMDQLRLFAFVGAHLTSINYQIQVDRLNGLDASSILKAGYNMSHAKTALVPRAGLGADFAVTDFFGIKAHVAFEKTDALKSSCYVNGVEHKFEPKNSFLVGASLYLKV